MGFDVGAFAFGLVIGWFTYFVNRYRKEVALADVATIIGAIGGGAVLALFPPRRRSSPPTVWGWPSGSSVTSSCCS